MQFLNMLDLAPTELSPTPPPPKKRLAKMMRLFEQVRTMMLKRKEEEARALAMVQHWRLNGCSGPKANQELLQQVADPTVLNLPAHIWGQPVEEHFPTVQSQFPFTLKTNPPKANASV
eukprot:TRINITY_DN44868_c0_g1_i2.p1 TRINITY_DN44868_c0_g1~~TRINITY_DN44868_c0_g1_i2.p1  ORF type:complete len:118 (-),score=27.20 TRINITY_DN44868_c0_g1_i2:187-540(-)